MEKQRENRCPNQIVWHLINEAKLILEKKKKVVPNPRLISWVCIVL